MLRRSKKKDMGSPPWMVTFSDMMTLLLVFFVLLYSLSVLDQEKFRKFMASFQGIGILEHNDQPLEKDKEFDYPVPSNGFDYWEERERTIQEIFDTVQNYIMVNGLDIDIEIRMSDRGVVLEIKDEILFESGKAQLKPEAVQVLSKLSGLLNQLPYTISVEGHTDNRPINTSQFPSNWELSTGRAVSVVRFLAERQGVDPQKFLAVGYGEYHPRAPNDTPENMAKNRRVLIVINAKDPYS
ncbi:MAG: OmpA family protein [Syntrophomonadaceae bacterium]|nr:OmpA family protein [Syntrophomonadaceae bacterium]